jgi:hypothetical protein
MTAMLNGSGEPTEESYEGSDRQRATRRRNRIVAIVVLIALLLPIVIGTIAAVAR